MSTTLRTYDKKLSDFRRYFTFVVDKRLDDLVAKLAVAQNTTKAALYREAMKAYLKAANVSVSDEWL